MIKTSRLRVNFCHCLFHSTMVTLPSSDSSINCWRRAIFCCSSCCSSQSIQLWVSSIRLDLPNKMKWALASVLALATPIIDAAVTPEPPPETNQVSLLVNGVLSVSNFSSKATRVQRLSSLSMPTSTSPPMPNKSLQITWAACSLSNTISGCMSRARHLRWGCSNEYDLVTPDAEHWIELNSSPLFP